MSTVTPPPTPGRWKQFATALISPHGRCALAIFTAMLVGANFVAVGPGWVAFATVLAVIVLNTPWITSGTHERGLSGLIGALVALYLILLLEVYLGYTGLRFGPIGAVGRGWLASVDTGIIEVLNFLYWRSSALKSFAGALVFLIVYYGVHRFASRLANSINNCWAAIGGFVAVIIMFPFAHGFEGKQVAFVKATFDATSSLKTLGSYAIAKEAIVKENKAFKNLAAELQDKKRQQEREALVQAIHQYAKLLLQLDDSGRARTKILYKPEDTYETVRYLALPPETYSPRSDPEAASREGGSDSSVSATSVAHAEELRNKRDNLVNEVTSLQHERDVALTKIKIFVADEVNDELGRSRRSEVADDARSAVVQIIVLRDMADATRELQAKITELQARIGREDQANQDLSAEVARYRQFRLASMRRDAECAPIRRAVFERLAGPPPSALMIRFTQRSDGAGDALRRGRPPLDTLDPPAGLDAQRLNEGIVDKLQRDGIAWPPNYTVDNLAANLTQVNENLGGNLSAFIDISCRAGRDQNQIEADLTRIAAELPAPSPTIPGPR